MRLFAPLMAIALTFALGILIFAAMHLNPAAAVKAFLVDPLSNANGWSELLLQASPLCLIALGLAAGYRANVWNIGAEGQMYMGGIFATGVAIHLQNGGGAWLLPAMVISGAIG